MPPFKASPSRASERSELNPRSLPLSPSPPPSPSPPRLLFCRYCNLSEDGRSIPALRRSIFPRSNSRHSHRCHRHHRHRLETMDPQRTRSLRGRRSRPIFTSRGSSRALYKCFPKLDRMSAFSTRKHLKLRASLVSDGPCGCLATRASVGAPQSTKEMIGTNAWQWA